MFDLFRLWLGAVLSGFRTRRSLMLENLARRQLSLVTILSSCEINNFAGQSAKSFCYNLVAMFDLFRLWLGVVLRGFRTHRGLMLENLALRQQLAVFKRQQPRPRLGAIDKLFWVIARRFWAHWKKALLIVLPDTVARWHRSGFKLYWAMLCKVRNPVGGGRRISQQIRELDVLQISGSLAGDVKELQTDSPTRDLQMAADRTRPHTLC